MRYQNIGLSWHGTEHAHRDSKAKSTIQSEGKMSDRNSPSIEPHHEHGHLSKTPTGLGIEPLNIIVLGASFAGLSCAHHFLDYTINRLRITKAAPNYRLILISPSTVSDCFNQNAPRACTNPGAPSLSAPLLEHRRPPRPLLPQPNETRRLLHPDRARLPPPPRPQLHHHPRRSRRSRPQRTHRPRRADRQHGAEARKPDQQAREPHVVADADKGSVGKVADDGVSCVDSGDGERDA